MAEMHSTVSLARMQRWKPCRQKLAFFLPLGAGGRPSQKLCQKFGSKTAWLVAQSPGPFLLKDTGGLVEEALRKLAYLDQSKNSDLQEAVQVRFRV